MLAFALTALLPFTVLLSLLTALALLSFLSLLALTSFTLALLTFALFTVLIAFSVLATLTFTLLAFTLSLLPISLLTFTTFAVLAALTFAVLLSLLTALALLSFLSLLALTRFTLALLTLALFAVLVAFSVLATLAIPLFAFTLFAFTLFAFTLFPIARLTLTLLTARLTGSRGFFGIVASQLAAELAAEAIDLLLGPSQPFQFVTKHSLRRLLDAFTHLLDALLSLFVGVFGLLHEATVHEEPFCFDILFRRFVFHLTSGVVQLPGKQWLAVFRLFHDLSHFLRQVRNAFSLALELLFQFLSLFRVPQRLAVFVVCELLADVLLLLLNIPRFVPHLTHHVLEFVGRLPAEVVPQILKITFGASPFRDGSGKLVLFESL